MSSPIEDIRDIRAPLAIPDWWRWPLAIAAIVLGAVAIVLVMRWIHARRTRPLTPREQALASLLRAEKLARDGRSREWADLVAETVRAALSARLGHAILPQTTSELARAWATPSLAETPAILEVLEICDLARFARASLEPDALVDETLHARGVVERLFDTPIPAPASHRAPSPALQEATVAS